MSWPDGERYLFPLQSHVVSLLVSTLVFSRTGGILSHLNSSTLRFARFPPGNSCFYAMLAVFSLAFAATDAVFYLSRIGRIENPSCSDSGHLSSHSALSSYGLFASLALGQFSVSLRPLVQALGSCPVHSLPPSTHPLEEIG